MKKKLKIVVIALLLVLIAGVIIFGTSNSKQTGGKNTDNITEQSKENADYQDDKENDGSGLEVLKPDEVFPEDSSDASGSWGDTSESNTLTGNKTNKTDEIENGNQNEEDKENNGEEPEKDEDILEDDITWGDIY